jgi:hypothetical protein
MDVKDKITSALIHSFDDSYIRLEDDDGISGFVVSPRFEGRTSLDRQDLIEDALKKSPDPLTQEELRRVLMIAGLTPADFDAVGSPIRVHKVKTLTGGTFEILVHGRLSDAEYVRGALRTREGIQTTDPTSPPGAAGILMKFRASRTGPEPLTKDEILRAFRSDPYIEVMANP